MYGAFVVLGICCTVCCVFVIWYLVFGIYVFTLDAGLLARSQYSEGHATGQLDTGFS
jgi:hypothetical protein